MSPFFKRSRKSDKAAPAAESPAPSPETAEADENRPSVSERAERSEKRSLIARKSREMKEPALFAEAQPAQADGVDGPSRTERLSRAYSDWHRELAVVADEATVPIRAGDPAVVDLTHPHPTGASQLYSGKPTLLTSVIREESAQREAQAHLASLRTRMEGLSEQYGYAPVTLAIGHMSWTELPVASSQGREKGGSPGVSSGKALGRDAVEQMAVGAARADMHDVALGEELPGGPGADDGSGGDGSADEPASTPEALDNAAGERGGAPDEHDGAPDSLGTEPLESTEELAAARSADSVEDGASGGDAAAPKIREMYEAGLMRSARLDEAGPDDAYITLTARCDVNPAVLRALRSHGMTAEEGSRLRAMAADVARHEAAVAYLRELGRVYLPGFSYEDGALLGSFTHPGLVLLADLEAMKPYIETSGIMAALAGDDETRRLAALPLPPAEMRDRSPEAERGAGDRDPAELAIIEAIASGRSIVVDAPPGSQAVGTLAAIVADAAASGRSILYIPGRASSARALVDEMERLGLGDLVLDFSDLDTVARRIRTGMRLRGDEEDPADVLELRARLVAVRRELSEYVASLHDVDPQWGHSVHSLLERLARLTEGKGAPRSRVRLDSDTVHALRGELSHVQAQLEDASELGAFVGMADSPWAGADIHTAAAGEEAMALAKKLASKTIPAVKAQAERAAEETGLSAAETFEDWREQIEMLRGISHSLDIFLPQIFERSVQDMVIATASKEWRESHGEEMKGSERRRLTKQAKDYVRPGAVSHDLHRDLITVQRQREVWKRYSAEASWPKLPEGMTQIRESAREAGGQLEELEGILPGRKLRMMPLGELLDFLLSLSMDEGTMSRLPRANELVAKLKAEGFGGVVEDFSERGVRTEQIPAELDLIYSASLFEQLVGRSPALSRTTPANLAVLAAEVRRLDREHTETLAGPVSRAVVRIMRETISKRREDTLKLDDQLERHSTGALRDAIATYPRLVQASRPVWVIPSMITAEFVPPMPWADIVIMDEQDAGGLSSAVSMLMRGRQIVVMGNLRRARAEGGDSTIAAFADILPVCELPTLRAQHDELATQTLRDQGYADVLELVPSAKRGRKPSLVLVEGRGVPNPQSGMVEGPQVEVDAAVDAVVDHVLTRPGESLAVVCVSPAHAVRIREALARLAADSPQLAEFVSRGGVEPFAVLELTQTGGLRRDSIILTVGLGKTVHGRVLHTFGPLSTAGGLTGLVDAMEAARSELKIVSSLGPGEIGADKLSTPGPRLLEKLIDRADGREVPLDPSSSDEPIGALLTDLRDRLVRAGYAVASDFGFDDGVRIPLVAGDVELPGTWRVAVLVDDEAYVNEPSVRRRDRYWLERLESRGWAVIRTFSTSLFIDPDGQASLIVNAIKRARALELSDSVKVPVLGDEWAAPADGVVGVPAAGVPGSPGAPVSGGVQGTAGDPARRSFGGGVSGASRTDGASGVGEASGAGGALGGTRVSKTGSGHSRIPLHRDASGESNAPGSGPGGATNGPGGEIVTGGAALPKDTNWAEKLRNEAAVKRGPRPDVAKGLSLAAYTDGQLDEMVTWIAADGAERSRPEFVDALRKELGIEGRGMQVDTVLGHVVDRSGLAVGLGLGDSDPDAFPDSQGRPDSDVSPNAVSRLSGSHSSPSGSHSSSEASGAGSPSDPDSRRSPEAAQGSSEGAQRSPEVSQRSPYSADPASATASEAGSEGSRSPSDSSKATASTATAASKGKRK